METRRAKLSFTIIGSVASILLQIIFAANIAVFSIAPNFILVFVIIHGMLVDEARSSVTGFVLGLVYDFLSQGALGVMALVLAIIAYGASSLNKELLSGSWAVSAFFLLVAAFLGELLHAALLSILGFDNNFFRSFGMRVFPSTIYDSLFGLIVFPLMHKYRSRRRKDPGIIKGKLG